MLFTTTVHINYNKSARLYLQTENYPWVYEQFSCFEFHTVWRSDKFLGYLWSYLIKEKGTDDIIEE